MFRMVGFQSEGATLRGRLYYREKATRPSPVVIMAHGTSATITMVADRYADVYYQAGFCVLLYDHRNFGLSGGEPRQQINPWIQARGYRDAVDFVTTLPEIDSTRIAIWGDSYSGAEVIVVGAHDSRVKAIVVQIPACGPQPPPADSDGSLFVAFRETFLRGDVRGSPETTVGPIPVVSFDQLGTPSLLTPISAYRWFIEYGGRHGTNWLNWVTRVTPNTPAPFHAVLCAPHVQAPILVMIAPEDEMPGANPAVSRLAYEAAPEPKELFEIGGGHFGLLHYPSELFSQASAVQSDFLIRHLL
jgi:alpha-beta hydrolase superfamily lysophospholipase